MPTNTGIHYPTMPVEAVLRSLAANILVCSASEEHHLHESHAMNGYTCRYELERWGEFHVRAVEGLGYSATSSLSWILEGQTHGRSLGCKLPIGVTTRGLDEYLLVERVLSTLDRRCRLVAHIEYAAPIAVVGKSMTKRAAAAGITLSTYRRVLKRIHEEVYKGFDI